MSKIFLGKKRNTTQNEYFFLIFRFVLLFELINCRIYPDYKIFSEVSRPGLRDGHLIFSPDPYENASANQIDDFTNHVLATPPPTQNVHMATTEEFNRELSRLDISNLHGKILNE